MIAQQRNLWGIYPCTNRGWMKNTAAITTNLKFCIGTCFGMINKKIFTYIDYKEDYQRSIEYSIIDRGVLRYNRIFAKTKFGASGGVGKSATERLAVYETEINYLIQKYPGVVVRNARRAGEILLARNI